MTCASCKKDSVNIKVVKVLDGFVEICSNCGKYSEASGTGTSGILTRNRFDIRTESVKHEGDMLPPHEYDKYSRTLKPRDAFLKQFPETAHEHFTQQELDKAGYSKLKAKNKKKESRKHEAR